MLSQIEANYAEVWLLPPAIEDWIGKDHPARFIRELVANIDPDELGITMPSLKTGRPPYSVKLLLRVWLYGYWKRIRSTRKIEKACQEDMGFIWLCGTKGPDHNTLWRFFKTNKEALKALFKKTVKIAAKLEMIHFLLQAVDGTRIKGLCSGHGKYDQSHLEKLLQKIEEGIETLCKEIEEQHHCERNIQAGLPKALQSRMAMREKVKEALAKVKEEDLTHCHPSDPEARRMKCEGRNRFAYNAQAVVDNGSYIITAADVIQDQEDSNQLVEMGKQSVENTGTKPGTLLADGGYANAGQFAKAEDEEIEVLVPLSSRDKNEEKNPYHNNCFVYDKEADEFICPAGQHLKFKRERLKNKRTGRTVREYRNYKACAGCAAREKCTKSKHGRTMELIHGYEARERLRKRMELDENKKKWKKRGQIVELVFAWIKEIDGFRHWTAHGVENAKAQWSMLCSVWNLKQIYKKWSVQTINWAETM
jgi:transposase